VRVEGFPGSGRRGASGNSHNKRLADPKWGRDWPVKPPDSVPIDVLPDESATTDVADLPTKTPSAHRHQELAEDTR
jgi:hypothetical protein